jgi:Holliday junction resolvase RusA-like endonuclease
MNTFEILGEPNSLERHRFTNNHAYNPSKLKQKEFIKNIVFPEKTTEYLHIDFEFIFERPKSHLKMKEKPEYPKRKDIDNLVKFVLDAFNGLLYVDDSQVVSIKAVKKYGDVAKTVIKYNVIV